VLAKDFSNALLQLGQASTSIQFLEEFKSKFIEFRELVDNLENIPKEEEEKILWKNACKVFSLRIEK